MANKHHLPHDKYRGFRITTRFTEPEYIALSNLAKTQEMNVADFIRKCVKEWAQIKNQTQRKGLSDTC